jgi:hypothetical protein
MSKLRVITFDAGCVSSASDVTLRVTDAEVVACGAMRLSEKRKSRVSFAARSPRVQRIGRVLVSHCPRVACSRARVSVAGKSKVRTVLRAMSGPVLKSCVSIAIVPPAGMRDSVGGVKRMRSVEAERTEEKRARKSPASRGHMARYFAGRRGRVQWGALESPLPLGEGWVRE